MVGNPSTHKQVGPSTTIHGQDDKEQSCEGKKSTYLQRQACLDWLGGLVGKDTRGQS